MTISSAAGRLLAFFHDMPRHISGELQHLPVADQYANIGLESPDRVDSALHELHENGHIQVTPLIGADTAAGHTLATTDTVKLLDLRPVPRVTTSTSETGIIERPQTDPTDLTPTSPTGRHDLGTAEDEAAKPVPRAADEGAQAEPGVGQDPVGDAGAPVGEDAPADDSTTAVDNTSTKTRRARS